jgi:hypothetical protein
VNRAADFDIAHVNAEIAVLNAQLAAIQLLRKKR